MKREHVRIEMNQTFNAKNLVIGGVIPLLCGISCLVISCIDFPKKEIIIDDGDYGEDPIVPDSMIDARDGQSYSIHKIGHQTWMTQNLNFKVDSSWCYQNDTSNCQRYGRLYSWKSANQNQEDSGQGVCPLGWHIPSDEDWERLATFGLKGTKSVVQTYSTTGIHLSTDWERYVWPNIGDKMKSKTGWLSGGNGSNVSGFNAVPGGFRTTKGYSGIGEYGYWWSTSQNVAAVLSGDSYFDYFKVNYPYINQDAFSVRCIRNHVYIRYR